MRPNRFQTKIISILIAAVASSLACQPKKPAPAPKKGAQDEDATKDDKKNGDKDTKERPSTPPTDDPPLDGKLGIEPKDQSQFKITEGKPARFDFRLTGVGSKNVTVGLSELPDSTKLTQTGTSVAVNWSTPKEGTFSLRFLVRDMDKCKTAESNDEACNFKEADFGKLVAKAYDVKSQVFRIEVTDGTGSGSGSGSGTGSGTGTGTGAGNNGTADLIQQILALLGGNGTPDIQNLLKNLSGGELTNILNVLQNGGDISSILGLITGLNLQDENGGIKPNPHP